MDLYIIKTKHWDDSLTNHIAVLHAALIWKPLWIHEGRVPLQACLRETSLYMSVIFLGHNGPLCGD